VKLCPVSTVKLCAVAWDIDGTLVDSEPVHLLALQKVCNTYKVDISDLPAEHFVGVNLYQVWQALANRFGGELTQAEWIAELNQHYLELAHRIEPLPGAYELVQALTARGVTQVAVSNSNRAVVDANLAVRQLASHMRFSISLDDVATGKPDPAPYLQATARLNLVPAQVLAIEDSLTGLRSAKAAGLYALGYAAHAKVAGMDAIADAVVSHLDQVLTTVNFEVSHGIHHSS
jgi:HAD superfamily hydrolase (TIGR01509 family)